MIGSSVMKLRSMGGIYSPRSDRQAESGKGEGVRWGGGAGRIGTGPTNRSAKMAHLMLRDARGRQERHRRHHLPLQLAPVVLRHAPLRPPFGQGRLERG
jgi:hypothetical protein